MDTGELILFLILLLMSLGAFAVSQLQWRERGAVFHIAYLYASRQERETMDRRPYYRQAAVVFLLIGILFLCNALEVLLHSGWLPYLSILDAAAAVVYAVGSTIRIRKKTK